MGGGTEPSPGHIWHLGDLTDRGYPQGTREETHSPLIPAGSAGPEAEGWGIFEKPPGAPREALRAPGRPLWGAFL